MNANELSDLLKRRPEDSDDRWDLFTHEEIFALALLIAAAWPHLNEWERSPALNALCAQVAEQGIKRKLILLHPPNN